eukprot:gene9912-18516_t
MHAFPKDEKQRRLWVQFVRRHRAGFTPSSLSALCSIHFKPIYFVRRIDITLESTSTGITRQRRLEIGAVPSIDAAGSPPESLPSKRQQRHLKRKPTSLSQLDETETVVDSESDFSETEEKDQFGEQRRR